MAAVSNIIVKDVIKPNVGGSKKVNFNGSNAARTNMATY